MQTLKIKDSEHSLFISTFSCNFGAGNLEYEFNVKMPDSDLFSVWETTSDNKVSSSSYRPILHQLTGHDPETVAEKAFCEVYNIVFHAAGLNPTTEDYKEFVKNLASQYKSSIKFIADA